MSRQTGRLKKIEARLGMHLRPLCPGCDDVLIISVGEVVPPCPVHGVLKPEAGCATRILEYGVYRQEDADAKA
jgi:hypothetical protein